jgi:predicted Zn-dependent protease
VSIGAGMASEVESTETILDDASWQAYVDEIGQKIVAVCDRRDIEYHFAVIDSDIPNAFAAPGGYIYFYAGLLKEMETESELAAVVAHEVSHVVARHSVRRMQTALGASLAYQLVFGEDASEAVNAAIGVGLSLALSGYSRSAEREADQFGIIYMREAGYNPNGALNMFETLASLGDGGQPNVFEQMLSSHPDTQERIANAKAQIGQMGTLSPTLVTGRDRYQSMRARLK